MIYGRTIREKRKRIDHWKEQTYESEKEVKVFTYGIDLTKQGEGGAKLSGVEFKLTDGTNEINVLKSGEDRKSTRLNSSHNA